MASPRPAAIIPPVPAGKLEPDAIGVVQDTVIGMASSAPAATVGLTLAALAAASAYGGGPVLIVTAVPMLVIANAYRRLNMWNATCGASFEWVGRAISPYLGFLTGWLMIVAYLTGTVSGVIVLGPSVLAVAGSGSGSARADVAIGTLVCVAMLVIAIAGIKITARAQVGMAAVEYAIVTALAIAGVVFVASHHAGTVSFSRGWLSLSGIGGKGGAVAGFLVAVFIYAGWDGTVYVSEEVRHRRRNPGKAAIFAVALLAVFYTLAQVGLQGLVSPARLQAHAATAPVYAVQALGGVTLGRIMAAAIALSVIATTGTGIVLTARIILGMASRRVLPAFLADVSPRFATPVAASVATFLALVALAWVFLLATSVQGAFNDVIAVTGQLFAIFYILTAVAAMAYYRRRILASARDALTLGALPLGAAGFLGWMLVRSAWEASAPQNWSLAGIVLLGLILMLAARFGLRSQFFAIRRESDGGVGIR